MATYRVTAPDGQVYQITAPDNATSAEVQAFVMKNVGKQAPKVDPTEGMSTTDKLLAGVGKGMSDIAYGAGQRLGLVPQAEADARKERDAPLMNTTAGKVGNVGGSMAVALPSAFVPGANTLAVAGATGGALGFLQPTASDESTVENVFTGTLGGIGGVLAGRALKAGYQGLKALAEPFTEAGRARIAGRTLQRFADDASSIAGATSKPTVTGARPTLAEQTGDVGIARLEDALRSLDPQINNVLAGRIAENNAARVNALQSLAGTPAKRDAAIAAREAASSDLYKQATKATYTVDQTLEELLNRPAVRQAMSRAETLAANQGRSTTFDVKPGNPFAGVGIKDNNSKQITGQALQDLKMAMDEMLSDPASGFTGKAGSTIRDLRSKLLTWMEDRNPAFKAARTTFAEKSKPINAMDVGEYLAEKGTSNLSDLAGNPRLQANALLGALRNEEKAVRTATGRKELNALAQVFEPDQLALINAIKSEADRAAAVASAGAGPGSATAQRMASQNILQQIIGPTGLPQSWAESVLANTLVGKPFNLVYGGVAEPKIQQALAQAVLDPDAARKVLQEAAKANVKLPDSLVKRLTATAAQQSVPATALVSRER